MCLSVGMLVCYYRFRRLSSVDRVCLEHEEDLALTGLLVNMAAFMVAMGVKHSEITGKVSGVM